MSHEDMEIEIKIRLDDEEVTRIKENLSEFAEFIKTSKQEDSYFTPKHRNFLDPKFPFEWLSIRKKGGKLY